MNVNNVNLETFRPPLSLLLVALLVAFLSLLCTSNSKAQITVYQTVADGNWQTPGTWLNGIKPKLNNPIGDNIQIIINHKVGLQGKKLSELKVACIGAGAAAIGCLRLWRLAIGRRPGQKNGSSCRCRLLAAMTTGSWQLAGALAFSAFRCQMYY